MEVLAFISILCCYFSARAPSADAFPPLRVASSRAAAAAAAVNGSNCASSPNDERDHVLSQYLCDSDRVIDLGASTSTTSITSSRRLWLNNAAKLIGGAGGLAISSFAAPRPSYAASKTTVEAATDAKQATTTFPTSLCDPSVSTWRNPTNGRIVHIIGTAHISESSAQLAGTVVKDVRPDAVFVELDRKRIARAMPKRTGEDSDAGGGAGDSSDSSAANNAAMAEKMADAPTGATATDEPQQQQQRRKNPFAVKERLTQAGAKLVGDAIKNMYSKLDSEGFKAGEEFVIAIREGLAINAAIVLGDRDVEVTLRRLTEALSKTDLKKLFASDSDLERSLDSLMPNGGGGGGQGGGAVYGLSEGGSKGGSAIDDKVTKEQFKQFVETVKARENVRLVMSKLKETAPELYEAMVAERDAYMARGLATLDQFATMVAVMGIAHVDGVEANLKEKGWVPVSVPCQIN